MATRRKGLGKGRGKGYSNIICKDPAVHSQSARGVKQPQRIGQTLVTKGKWCVSRTIGSDIPFGKVEFHAYYFDESGKLKKGERYGELMTRKEADEFALKKGYLQPFSQKSFEKIQLVSNLNTINLKEFKKEKPLSYAFLSLDKHLDNSGMRLEFINQDANRVYFKIHNKINKYTTGITELSNEELLKMDMYIADGLKEEVWNKTI